MKKELHSNRLELNETKERAISLSTRLNELENQHAKTVGVVFGIHPLRRKLFRRKVNRRNSTIFFSTIYLFGHHSFDNISFEEKTFGEMHIGNHLCNRHCLNNLRKRFLRSILFFMLYMLRVSKK